MAATYITRDGDMIDAICFKHYGSHDGGQVEAVLEVNRGLAAQPPVLPRGLTIALPDVAPKSGPALIRLWD